MPDAAVRRILIDRDPFADREPGWSHKALWPAHWIALPGQLPYVVGYRFAFSLDAPTDLTLHVTADERYELSLDGELIGRGSDRGDVDYWTFESYSGELAAGEHLLAARVWSLGAEAPFAQHTFGHGFLLAAEGADLDTGSAAWEAAILPGHGTRDKGAAWGCGLKFESDGREFPWGWERGTDSLTWSTPTVGERGYAHAGATDMEPGRMLIPAILPGQYSAPFVGGRIRHVAEHPGGPTHATPIRAADSVPAEVADWQALVEGAPLTIPANTRRRVLLDLDE